jgi:hypothetical protein
MAATQSHLASFLETNKNTIMNAMDVVGAVLEQHHKMGLSVRDITSLGLFLRRVKELVYQEKSQTAAELLRE